MSQTTPSSKLTVFVVGGSGNTGSFVVNGLLQSGNFHVIVLTRPESEEKPKIQVLKEKGVEIRLGDISKLSVFELEKLLKGVNIVLSLATASVLDDQKKVFQAAKNVGVERVVPSDFATFFLPERLEDHPLANQKRSIHSFIKELGIGYTFIDVGWWMEGMLPCPPADQGYFADFSRTFIGSGDVKTAVTTREDIGRFVARILHDPRTLNKYVFCHAEEVTLNEVYRIAEKVSGENFDSVKILISADELGEKILQEKEKYKNDPSGKFPVQLIIYGYQNSILVHGDNTVNNAKKSGALDALELYPDFKPVLLEEYAKEFYRKRPEFSYEF